MTYCYVPASKLTLALTLCRMGWHMEGSRVIRGKFFLIYSIEKEQRDVLA